MLIYHGSVIYLISGKILTWSFLFMYEETTLITSRLNILSILASILVLDNLVEALCLSPLLVHRYPNNMLKLSWPFLTYMLILPWFSFQESFVVMCVASMMFRDFIVGKHCDKKHRTAPQAPPKSPQANWQNGKADPFRQWRVSSGRFRY